MKLPGAIWQQMLLLITAVLVGWSIPLIIITLIRRRLGKEVRSLWVKYGSWFVMVPAMAIPMLLGARVTQVVFLGLSLYAFEEFSRAVGLWKEASQMWLGRACIVLLYLPVFLRSFGTFMSMPAYVIIITFLYPILGDRFQGMIQRSCLTIFGVIYFGWFLAHLAYLLNIDAGRQLILAFMLIVVTNDASAYIIGSNLGRHHMVPNLSPNKTWEGAIGALVIASVLTVLLRFALLGMPVPVAVGVGLVLAAGGTCGDLCISLIKRDVHIKDTGNLIPGHGGLLDRLDSILFVAPLFFHFMNAFFIPDISL